MTYFIYFYYYQSPIRSTDIMNLAYLVGIADDNVYEKKSCTAALKLLNM